MSELLHHTHYETEYFVYGSGKKVLFAFHGFGNKAQDLEHLGTVLGKEYTIVSINLLFHGKSTAVQHLVDQGLSIDHFKQWINSFFDRYPSENVELLGFSLGGRIAMKIAELFPERIKKLHLLAPDGLTISPFYRLSTLNSPGRFLFKRSIDQAERLIGLAHLLKKIRILDEKKFQLAMYHLESREHRQRVYDVWMVYRKIRPDLPVLKRKIFESAMNVHLYFGKYDKIILPEWGQKLQGGLEEKVKIHLMDSGHQLLRPNVLEQIGAKIKNDAE